MTERTRFIYATSTVDVVERMLSCCGDEIRTYEDFTGAYELSYDGRRVRSDDPLGDLINEKNDYPHLDYCFLDSEETSFEAAMAVVAFKKVPDSFARPVVSIPINSVLGGYNNAAHIVLAVESQKEADANDAYRHRFFGRTPEITMKNVMMGALTEDAPDEAYSWRPNNPIEGACSYLEKLLYRNAIVIKNDGICRASDLSHFILFKIALELYNRMRFPSWYYDEGGNRHEETPYLLRAAFFGQKGLYDIGQ